MPRSVVAAVADGPHSQRYEDFAVNSFVDDQRQIVWCPAPGGWYDWNMRSGPFQLHAPAHVGLAANLARM